MKVIYQTANPRKKKTAKKVSRVTRKIAKRRNPEEVTYGKGGRTEKVTTYTSAERAEMIKGRHTLKQAKHKLASKKVGGSGRASNLLNKKRGKLSSALDKHIARIDKALNEGKNAEAKKLALKLEGFKPRDKRTTSLRGDLREVTSRKIASSVEKHSKGISEMGRKKLQDKIKKGKKIAKASKAVAKKAERSAEVRLLQTKLASSKQREKELTKLLSLGASDKDKADLVDIKNEIKALKSQMSHSKGVGMAKKKKKVAKKATKVAKKTVKRTAKKKASTKRRGTKRSKAKKVAKVATVAPIKRKRRKSSKALPVAKKAMKVTKRKTRKSKRKATKRKNPYVVSNPYIKSNPMFTKVDSILDRVLGVSTVELGGIVLATFAGGKITEYAKKIPVLGEQIAKIPAQYQATAINGLVSALLLGAEHFMAKKKMKQSAIVGDLGRGFAVLTLIKGIEASGLATTDSTMAGPYIESQRSMAGYVLDNGMGSVGLDLSDSDFKGGADFDGSTLGAGADFDGSTIGSMNDSVSDNFDFESNPTFW